MKLFKSLSLLVIVLMLTSLWGCSGSGDSSANSAAGSKISAKLVGGDIQVSGATDDQQNPQVIYLADKKMYFVVWEDWRFRNLGTTDFPSDPAKFSGADIWAQFINPDGTFCGEPFPVTDKLNGNQTAPSVAYKPGDKLVVTWQDTVGTSTGGFVRYASITSIPSAGSCAVPPVVTVPAEIGFTQFEQYDPNALIGGTATFSIVGDGTGGSDVVGGAVLTPYIMPRSIVVTGSYPAEDTDNQTSGPLTPVQVQDDGQGKLIGSGASGTINYMTGKLDITLINEVDTGATANFSVTYSSLSGTVSIMQSSLLSRKSPKVDYDSAKDQFALTWVESRNVNSYASVLCFGVAPVTWVTGDSTFVGYLYLDPTNLAPKTNSLGIANADVIRSEITSSMKLVSTSLTSDKEIYTYDFFTNINGPNLASDITSPETLFVWEGERNIATITCTLDTTTNTITSTFASIQKDDGKVHIYGIFDKELILNTVTKWIDFNNTGSGTNPSLAVDNASVPRKFLVAWEDMRGGNNTKIFGQLINSGGGLYNDNRILSYQDSAGVGSNDSVITNSRQTRPTVSYDAVNQRYFVMWQDERNSSTSLANIDLYGQYVNLDGSLSGANYAISSNPSNQLAPSVAYDSYTKQFIAVWKDARTPSTTASDVYGQIFTLGQPQLTLLTATTPAEQLVPAVHDFLTANTGTTVTWQFLVKNTGDAALNISALTKQPSSPFTIAPTNAATLDPGSSATYTVTYLPTSSGTYNSSFTLESDGGNQVVALSATGVGLNPLTITTPSSTFLPDASTNVNYSIQMVAAGGFTPLIWSATGLPSGLGIDSKGLVSGIATVPGIYTVVITVKDGTSPTPVSFSRTYSLRVGSISISTSPLSAWTQSVDYLTAPTHSVSGTGGTGSLVWMLLPDSGSLPPGISMNNAGVFSGAANQNGTYFFTVEATDSSNQSAQAPFSISINPKPTILTDSLPPGLVGKPYSKMLSAGGGTPSLVWSLSGGLPTGLLFDTATGAISGTPTASDSYELTFSIKDAAGATDSKKMTLEIVTPGSTSPSGGSTNILPPSSGGGGGGCFIATAAYGSYLDPHVMVLRHFRDNVLLKTELGSAFVQFYYTHSPPIADFIAQHETLRILFRIALTPLVFGAEYPIALGLIFSLAAGWFIRRRLGLKAQVEMVNLAG